MSFPAIKVITQQIKWTGLMHYNPWIMPSALEFLVRTRDKYPLSKVVSHSFPLAEVNKAFAFAEWQGKNAGHGRDAGDPQAVAAAPSTSQSRIRGFSSRG